MSGIGVGLSGSDQLEHIADQAREKIWQQTQELFDLAPDCYLVTDLEGGGVIRQANRVAAALFHISTDSLIGNPLILWISAEDHPLFLKQMARVKEGDLPDDPFKTTQLDLHILPHEGAPILVDACVNLYLDAAGQPVGQRWIMRDVSVREQKMAALRQDIIELTQEVTECTTKISEIKEKSSLLTVDMTVLKKAEYALKETKLQLENQKHFIARIMESIPISLVVIDRAMRIISVNRNFLEKTRRDVQATLGHKMEEVFPQVLLEYTRLNQRVQEVFRSGLTVEGGKLVYRAPGLPSHTYFYRLIPIYLAYRASSSKGTENGQVENVMLLMDDITEREQLGEDVRRIERHLAGVVDCANDLVVSMDPQGLVITWNRAAEMISGFLSEQVKGHSLVSYCLPEHQRTMTSMLEKLKVEANVKYIEANLLNASGQEVPIAWVFSPMLEDFGGVGGIVAVGRDLTEHRRLEAQLIQSTKMASLGVLVGGIAHELRNPLGIISASSQLVLEHPEDGQLRGLGLHKIYSATQRASLIIENLLKFAHPEIGWTKEKVDLISVLDDTLLVLSHQISLQNITLNRIHKSPVPDVYGNHGMLQQVFTNLILNACNAMPQGGELVIEMSANLAGIVEISFSDTGGGVAPEHLSKIFDPFFTTMPVGKGAGLGLSVSHSIVEQHQGVIEVQSQLGKGTTFKVRLPGIK